MRRGLCFLDPGRERKMAWPSETRVQAFSLHASCCNLCVCVWVCVLCFSWSVLQLVCVCVCVCVFWVWVLLLFFPVLFVFILSLLLLKEWFRFVRTAPPGSRALLRSWVLLWLVRLLHACVTAPLWAQYCTVSKVWMKYVEHNSWSCVSVLSNSAARLRDRRLNDIVCRLVEEDNVHPTTGY